MLAKQIKQIMRDIKCLKSQTEDHNEFNESVKFQQKLKQNDNVDNTIKVNKNLLKIKIKSKFINFSITFVSNDKLETEKKLD